MVLPSPTPDTPAEVAARVGHQLEVQCRRCRHRALVMAGVYGEAGQRPLNRMGEILRCTNCGTRGDVRVRLAERR